MTTNKSPPQKPAGSERARDEARAGGPRYGGEGWQVADERGDRRFGHARNDDADPLELIKPGQGENEDDDSPGAADPDVAVAEASREVESSGQQAGIRRGEKPRKSKDRAKR